MAAFTHEQLAARLQALAFPVTPDHLHGLLAGLACAGIPPTHPEWDNQLVACLDEVDVPAHRELLEALFTLCEQALAAPDYSFQPLLPDDEEFLTLRAQALAQWCDGFINGFVAGQRELAAEDRETLEDIAEISQLEPDEGYNDPAEAHVNEADFFELCEYVRMAVISLYALHGAAPQTGGQA